MRATKKQSQFKNPNKWAEKENDAGNSFFTSQMAKKSFYFQQSVNMALFFNDNNRCLILYMVRLQAGLVPAMVVNAYGEVICESGTLFQP
jgi:hypothetical protein